MAVLLLHIFFAILFLPLLLTALQRVFSDLHTYALLRYIVFSAWRHRLLHFYFAALRVYCTIPAFLPAFLPAFDILVARSSLDTGTDR